MIDSNHDEQNNIEVIILRPNNSLTWKINLVLLLAVMIVSLSIALGFLIAGAWVILPFSILELMFISICVYYSARQCALQEVIRISELEISIESGFKKPSMKKTYQRVWSKFFVRPSARKGDLDQLVIRSHGRELEIGSFLSREDKAELVLHLRKSVATSG
ncbi:MAG: hypothetical protein CMQ40_12640 [Gammaproteobacteria bacterium]|nr:hypothetical protein [Gammaproteobacteria bacterium]|tara:strand:- start:49 stop:531 length:483 start_codon:yes stop_codon:yes gene_type:complete